MYAAIMLDADDTLFDFRKAEDYALERSFAQFELAFSDEVARGYDLINKELWRRLEAGDIDQTALRTERFRLLFEKLGIASDALAFGSAYVAWLSKASFLIDGAEALCEYLSGKYILALVTNGIREVQLSRFERSPIKKFFAGIAVSEEAKSSKPDPGIFEYACELIGFHDKAGIIMVGDSLSSDIRGGQNFGIDTCWYNPSGSANDSDLRPTYEVRKLEEIAKLL